jgi:hypothetical protein
MPAAPLSPTRHFTLSENELTCIFQQLPYYDLIPLSRVSKTWHRVVFSKNIWKNARIDNFVFYMHLDSFWLFVERLCKTGALDCLEQLATSMFNSELEERRKALALSVLNK